MVFLQAGNTSKVFDSTGRQGSLEAWLSLDNAFTSLLKPAGYEYDGKQWSKNPGKIDRGIIEKAHNEGLLTDDQYNLIQLAAGQSTSNDDKSEKISLINQLLTDYQKANAIKTQTQINFVNRAWEWIGRKWNKWFGEKNTTENNTNKFKQLNEKYEKVKNVKYSNDINKIYYDSNYKPLETTLYFNCIGFVCYMFNISASYSVKNFEQYSQFYQLKDVKNVNQLQIGDIITWEYESGKVDKNNKLIYNYHVSIWKGNGEVWECMDSKGVRTREYQGYYNYMNNKGMKIKTVKYFRFKEEN